MPDLLGSGYCLPQRCQQAGRQRLCHLETPAEPALSAACSPLCAANPCGQPHHPDPVPSTAGLPRLQQLDPALWFLQASEEWQGKEDVSSQAFADLLRKHQDGMGEWCEPKCGFGLAATPTSCNHLQPLECTGETGEIYLLIVGICGQWVFLMKTICFCVFPENIIPQGKWYSHPFQQYHKNSRMSMCVYLRTHTHTQTCMCG